MKNIHVLPTNKPSSLHLLNSVLVLCDFKFGKNTINGQNIYITSDEEIKEGVDQWYLDKVLNEPYNSGGAQYSSNQDVIILTTDQDLIKDGVQSIHDTFLEWFVKNSSCEWVGVELKTKQLVRPYDVYNETVSYYKIIIPKEEPKQVLCGEANKFYRCITCDAPCGSEGHYIEVTEEQSNNDMNKILWISNNPQCKLIESCYNSLSKKCICPKEEPKQVTEQLNIGAVISSFNTKSKRMVKVISGDDVFEGEVTAMSWDIDQWAFMVDGEWYCQSEINCL